MAVLVGSGSGRLTDSQDVEIPFELCVTVEVGASREVRVQAAEVRATGHAPVTPDVLRHAAAGLEDFADYVAARTIRNQEAHQRWDTAPDYTWGPSRLVLGPRVVEELQRELSRRRRSRLSQADYEKVARVYRDAVQHGDPAQKAVAEAMFVTKSRASALIQEARRRDLIPPARKGRKQSL